MTRAYEGSCGGVAYLGPAPSIWKIWLGVCARPCAVCLNTALPVSAVV